MRARSSETYALSKRGEAGLACDLQGVALGPVALVEKTGDGPAARYRRRPLAEIEKALKLAYGKASVPDLARALTGLEAAARALNRRRLFDAAMAAKEMRLQPLSPQAVTKLLAAAPGFRQVPLAKAFNPDQPRVPAGNPGGGQWAGDNSGTANESTSHGEAMAGGESAAGGSDESTSHEVATTGTQYAENNLVATDSSPASAKPDWRDVKPLDRLSTNQLVDWEKFKQTLARTPGLTNLQRQAFLQIFGIEGCLVPDGRTVAGLTPSTVTDAISDGGITGARANARPKDLTLDQIVQGYYYYLDDVLGHVGGISAIDRISDPKTAAAVADTLFREGEPKGAPLLVAAANSVLTNINPVFRLGLGLSELPTPNVFGPQTLNTLVTLSNAGLGPKLRTILATLRADKHLKDNYDGERYRAYYFQ